MEAEEADPAEGAEDGRPTLCWVLFVGWRARGGCLRESLRSQNGVGQVELRHRGEDRLTGIGSRVSEPAPPTQSRRYSHHYRPRR